MIQQYNYPKQKEWPALCKRAALPKDTLEQDVKAILQEVKNNGDEALFAYAQKFDKATLSSLKVSEQELDFAQQQVSASLKESIALAAKNIRKFHSAQQIEEPVVETSPGVQCWRKSVAIEKVGLYIPGGTAPLFSSILMLAIPAQIAGCKQIVLCTPPASDGSINPAVLYTAQFLGIDQIFKVGGAQAIAAMTYGTESIPNVYKIAGPGNQYVTKAKELVQQEGVSIDMPAGPSEVLVVADESANPEFVAADLLSQAEHGTDSQVILLATNPQTISETLEALNRQLTQLPREQLAVKALQNSRAILLNSIEECIAFSNTYAPEHLILASNKAKTYTQLITNAGSVFLGNYSCESAGDYASGTNHTLPTNGYAKSYSGVSVDSFVKKISFQEISSEGIQTIGPAIETMAEAEMLFAHKNAVQIRLKSLSNV